MNKFERFNSISIDLDNIEERQVNEFEKEKILKKLKKIEKLKIQIF